MNKELVKVEEGQLIIANKVIEKIKDLEQKKKKIDELQKEYKEKLVEVMENNGIKSFESNDKTLKITCIPSETIMTFDSKKFSEEHFGLYLNYQKESKRKGSVRITVRDKGEE